MATQQNDREPPDNFDYAVTHVWQARRHLKNHLLEIPDDSADAIACWGAIRALEEVAQFLSPDINGDWPREKDGMGVILPFIPRQRG